MEHRPLHESVSLPNLQRLHELVTAEQLDGLHEDLITFEQNPDGGRVFSNLRLNLESSSEHSLDSRPGVSSNQYPSSEQCLDSLPGVSLNHYPSSEQCLDSLPGVSSNQHSAQASALERVPKHDSVVTTSEQPSQTPATEQGPKTVTQVLEFEEPLQVRPARQAPRRRQYPKVKKKTGFRAFCRRTKGSLGNGIHCLVAACYLTCCVLFARELP